MASPVADSVPCERRAYLRDAEAVRGCGALEVLVIVTMSSIMAFAALLVGRASRREADGDLTIADSFTFARGRFGGSHGIDV
jgi:hypothetical protein